MKNNHKSFLYGLGHSPFRYEMWSRQPASSGQIKRPYIRSHILFKDLERVIVSAKKQGQGITIWLNAKHQYHPLNVKFCRHCADKFNNTTNEEALS